MEDTATQNVVQSTNDYDQFDLMEENRNISRGHVEALKQAFEEVGNLTRVQPILVNDRMQIIDGQHRFVACKELEEPIYYTMVPGLNISDARTMNILHRRWYTEDYARSFASTDPNYRKYLELNEEYDFNPAILLPYILGGEPRGGFKRFRQGEFVIQDEAGARERLDRLAELVEIAPILRSTSMARALLRLMRSDNYDHKRMARKLRLHAPILQRFSYVEDNARQLEELYNYKMSKDRVRLF